MLRHLAPVIISETVGKSAAPNAAFKVVEELIAAIKDPNVKNVAVSADYGAGKSSVVETAKEKIIKDEDIHWWRFKRKKKQTKFLTISLAQLNVRGRCSKKGTKPQGNEANVLERDKDIEYSLLQQLLYYDLPSKTPKSRFYRLGRSGVLKPLAWALCIILAFLCYLVLLEPDYFRVDSFYKQFAVSPELKFWIDCFAAFILAILFVLFCEWLVRHARFRIGKVKVKDAEVEVNTLSVFNQYLDEIFYFFASTRYNVLVFEDLDRFPYIETGRIFGKLRELNKILNSSKYLKRIIKREITFVYSVRDDLFGAVNRVKFFDYIVPVIPVVNSYNAYEKLTEYLSEEDKADFDGKDLLNLCDYFEDLRLIINIVNEYDLYKKVIRIDDFSLSRKKLFGLIVYKNYCPHDFIHLHNRKGVLANILDNKKRITDEVIKARKQRKIEAEEKLNGLKVEAAEWDKKLRKEYVEAAKSQTGYRSSSFEGFELEDGTHVSFERVAEEADFFEELVNDKISFYGGNGQTFGIKSFADWQKVVHSKPYQERLKQNPHTREISNQQEIVDGIEPLKFSSADTLSLIISKESGVLDYYLDKEPVDKRPYIPEEQHPLLRFLLTHDFLDEHYLDYITYFYQNSISIEDKRFILNITSLGEDALPYTYHLLNPASVADRFDMSDYETNARLLNVDLALSLTRGGDQQKENRNALQKLAKRTRAIDFVQAVYERQPNSDVDTFLTELLEYWDFGVLIQSLEDKNDERISILREINLRYSNLKDPKMFNSGFQMWVNAHFGFVATLLDKAGEKRLRDFLGVYKTKFSKINLAGVPSSFADFIIDGEHYTINPSNIDNIVSHLRISDDFKRGAFTALYKCANESVAFAIKQRPQEFIKVFPSSSVDEAPWAKALIAADSRIAPITRKDYLSRQETKIQEAKDLKESALDFVFKHSLIEPSWKNLYYLCFEMGHEAPTRFLKDNTLEGFLTLKPEQHKEIISQWVFSNVLSFEVYERVVSTMYGFKKLDSGVETRRITVLVSKKLLLFNPDNYSDMCNYYPSLVSKFIAENLNTYIGDVGSYIVTTTEMSTVLHALGSCPKQAEYISNHPVLEGFISSDVADVICGLIKKRNLKIEQVEEGLLIQAINYSSVEDIRLFVARKALLEVPYNQDRTKGILLAMGGEYARICDAGQYSWLLLNTNNNRLAKFLSDNGFIKGYMRYNGKIKINKL